MPKIAMSEGDLARAVVDGVWYPLCLNCENHTPAEPDAEFIYCIHCDQLIEIENPYF